MTKAGIFAALAGGVLAILAVTGFWLWRATPVPMPDAPGGRFACVSYAPFRGEQTPFDQNLVIPPAQIEEDLSAPQDRERLRAHLCRQSGPRSGAADRGDAGHEGSDGPVDRARQPRTTRSRSRAASNSPRRIPATIKGIIVGNEVLLRQEQPAAVLESLLKRVKAETGLPVTYADVWEFWLRHPELADDVDFVTIHILPYWEDDPVPAADGVAHIDAILRMVQAEMPGKTIYIGETGYPSAGKQRERRRPRPGGAGAASSAGSLPTPTTHGLDYNVIEAFDQPWKRALEGTVGGYWGVFSENRISKFPLTGPVTRMGSPWPWLGGTIALGIALWWPARRAAGGVIAASPRLCWPAPPPSQWRCTSIMRNSRRGIGTSGRWRGALAPSRFWSRCWRCRAFWRATMPGSRLLRRASTWLRRPWSRKPDATLALGALQLLAMAGGAVVALGLDFDQRYRDFPIWAFAVPAACVRPAASPLSARRGAAAGADRDLLCRPARDRRRFSSLLTKMSSPGRRCAVRSPRHFGRP